MSLILATSRAQTQPMRSQLTPRQVALAIGVSEASLKRWCDRGLLPSVRTVGGHRRLPIHGVLQFLRDRGQMVTRPELLGLPPATGHGPIVYDRARAEMRAALVAGDEDAFRRLGYDLWLGGNRLCEVIEKGIAPAFADLGLDVKHGRVEIFEERRAIEICTRFLHEMRLLLPPPAADAPLAIGGTADGDPYTLPTAMVELALREAGWRAESYGTGHPLRTLKAAIETVRPRLFWLSISHVSQRETFVRDFRLLHDAALSRGVALVLGGRGVDHDLRGRLTWAFCADSLTGMVDFAHRLRAASLPSQI